MHEIIYVCKSVNNKNVRRGELNILRKSESNDLCFEFGTDEISLKKRFYDNKEDFENDFNELMKLKKDEENELLHEAVVTGLEPEVVEKTAEKINETVKEMKFEKHKKGRTNFLK